MTGAELDRRRVTAPATVFAEVFDAEHVDQLYPPLAGLVGWWWSWSRLEPDAYLVGYRWYSDGSLDVLSIASTEHATFAHNDAAAECRHRATSDLAGVLALLDAIGTS